MGDLIGKGNWSLNCCCFTFTADVMKSEIYKQLYICIKASSILIEVRQSWVWNWWLFTNILNESSFCAQSKPDISHVGSTCHRRGTADIKCWRPEGELLLPEFMICDSHSLLQCYFCCTDQNRGPKRLGEQSRALMVREENVRVALFNSPLILLRCVLLLSRTDSWFSRLGGSSRDR